MLTDIDVACTLEKLQIAAHGFAPQPPPIGFSGIFSCSASGSSASSDSGYIDKVPEIGQEDKVLEPTPVVQRTHAFLAIEEHECVPLAPLFDDDQLSVNARWLGKLEGYYERKLGRTMMRISFACWTQAIGCCDPAPHHVAGEQVRWADLQDCIVETANNCDVTAVPYGCVPQSCTSAVECLPGIEFDEGRCCSFSLDGEISEVVDAGKEGTFEHDGLSSPRVEAHMMNALPLPSPSISPLPYQGRGTGRSDKTGKKRDVQVSEPARWRATLRRLVPKLAMLEDGRQCLR